MAKYWIPADRGRYTVYHLYADCRSGTNARDWYQVTVPEGQRVYVCAYCRGREQGVYRASAWMGEETALPGKGRR